MKLFALACVALAGLFIGCGEDSVSTLKEKSQRAFSDQKYGESRGYLHKILEKNPSDADALFLLGVAYRRDMIYDSALIFLKRSDLYRPLNRETNIQLYEVAQAVKDWRVAIDAIQILIKTGDRPEQHYAQLSEFWGRRDHPYNAYYYVKKALEVDPDREELWVQAANLANIVDSADASLRYADSAIAKFGDKSQFLNAKALYLMYKNRYDDAETIFRTVLARDTANTYARLNLANCLSSAPARNKKTEGLAIYKSLQGHVGAEFKIDSLVAAVESTLAAKK